MTLLRFLLNIPEVQQSLFSVSDQNSATSQSFISSRNYSPYSFLVVVLFLVIVICPASRNFTLSMHSLIFSQRLQRILWRHLKFFLWVFPFSLILCPTNSSHSLNPYLYSQPSETTMLCLECLSMGYNPESISKQNDRVILRLSVFVSILSVITTLYCQLSNVWKQLFHRFLSSFFFSLALSKFLFTMRMQVEKQLLLHGWEWNFPLQFFLKKVILGYLYDINSSPIMRVLKTLKVLNITIPL